MNAPSDLTLFSFKKRLAQFKSGCNDAVATLSEVNDKLKQNVEAQKILNKHLAERNAAMKALIKKPFKLEAVK